LTRPSIRSTAVTIVVTAAVAVAGCGGPPEAVGRVTPEPSSSVDAWDVTALPDPCRTVRADEVARITHQPVSPGVHLKSWPPLCQFTLSGPPKEFLYVSDDSRAVARQDFDRQRRDPATQPVDGLGEQAYWLPDFATLHVLNGPTDLVVSFAGPKLPVAAKDMAIAIARLALPRATPSP
jgi:hypothetical protein